MARRTQPPAPQPASLSPQQMRQGVGRLRKRLQALSEFDPKQVTRQYGCAPLEKLESFIDDGLIRTFGEGTIEYNRYSPAASINTGPIAIGRETPVYEIQEAVRESLLRSTALLEQSIDALEERLSEDTEPLTKDFERAEITDKVFIVHGHAVQYREALARFLTELGLEPVILHERPNEGRTLIEKFEAHGNVGFAVVLLTADDEGGLVGGLHQPRARQNVILELGYFIGRLGRSRVCALRQGDIELPSDFIGVVYELLDDAGAWKMKLARELQSAGFQVDWNKVMGNQK